MTTTPVVVVDGGVDVVVVDFVPFRPCSTA